MLFLLEQFGGDVGVLNVFRYLTFRTAGAVVTALFFVFLFGPTIIASLRIRQGKGQPIREDGPASHLLTKKGTPTMGGLMILAGFVVATLLWANLSQCLCLGRAVRHPELRRHRLLRRLPQGQAHVARRLQRPLPARSSRR